MKVEDLVSQYDEKINKKQYDHGFAPSRRCLTHELKANIPAHQVYKIVSEARKGIECVEYNIAEQILMDEDIFQTHHNMLFAKLVITCNEHSQYTPPEANT